MSGRAAVVARVDGASGRVRAVQVNHWWYKKQKAAFPDGPMGGYTRVLHCNETDDIMHMVPSIQVTAFSTEYVNHYPVVNRPWAIVQWLSRVRIQEQYILMTETDQIFVAPPPLLGTPERASTFPFPYMDCTGEEFRPFCEDPRFNPGQVPVEDIPPVCPQARRAHVHRVNVLASSPRRY